MTTRPNIGTINALIRMTIGFTILAWTTAQFVKRPWRDSNLLLALLASMKIAEGIVRYCPVTELCKMMVNQSNDQGTNQNGSIDQESLFPYNPT